MAWTFCSKNDVVSIHPVTADELQDEWSDFAEAKIREHLRNPYLGVSQEILNEYHSGDGSVMLYVKNPPLISVSGLYVNEVALTSAEYVIFDSYIQLRYMVFPRGNLNVAVSYLSGSAAVSDNVRFTAATMVVAILNYRKRMGADASIKWAHLDVKAGEETANVSIGLVDHLNAIMKRSLRRPVRVR